MKKIDRETVQRILDTADIVEVVSDFVNLKRRGANYIGLCPFHNERTPSFSVSKAKGICKCFSCGKGGSPVNFIMEHEQLSYYEALRYLARKYNIEIKEHEMTDTERQEASERESMLAVNDFALKHFEHNLTDVPDGRDIGLSYFRERGINDLSIKKFHLGYALDASDDLLKAAIAKGFSEKYLVETGLCIRSDRGIVYDRFKGRVIYPVFSISGKVVAFGGRTLRKDKNVAKYVNSPESLIYRKSYELYGLYQAKQAIVRKDKCILVEGYMDVISMHQSGVENVVASSGTSLTEGQIRMIHRFTENVTVIYDSDAAGIKASLRGIDMLLAEGLNIKVLLLPDGDDPDSYAQNHTSAELEAYLAENETDFIRFKTSILMHGVDKDPVARSRVINDIVRSISVIPNNITRSVYIKECSRMLDIDEKVLALQLAKMIAEHADNYKFKQQRANASAEAGAHEARSDQERADDAGSGNVVKSPEPVRHERDSMLDVHERMVIKYVLKYGMVTLCDAMDEDGNAVPMSLIDYVRDELANDDITFSNPLYQRAMDEALAISRTTWQEDYDRYAGSARVERSRQIAAGEEEIRRDAIDLGDIKMRESALIEKCDAQYNDKIASFASGYIEHILGSSPDDELRKLTTDLVSERYHLSKVHTKYAKVETEQERLAELVPRAIYELKYAILECETNSIKDELKKCRLPEDNDKVTSLMERNMELNRIKSDFAKYLGERIVIPRK